MGDIPRRTSRNGPVSGQTDELKALAGVCHRVPAYPARTFWEAMQCTWFCVVINDSECPGTASSSGRLDQFGIANVADSLAAVKHLVFDTRRLGLQELRAALTASFVGHESLRQMLRTQAPKFGNHNHAVDQIAAEEAAFYCREVTDVRTPENGPHLPLIFGTSPQAVFNFGKKTGALPDGRCRGEPLAMSCNPAHGRNVSGLTAELASVATLNFSLTSGGVSYIIDVHPCMTARALDLRRLTDALKTFFDQGGMEVGINVLSEQQLRDAQQNPQGHQHIMVRVFGFSSQFVSLQPALQEYVIGKCRHRS